MEHGSWLALRQHTAPPREPVIIRLSRGILDCGDGSRAQHVVSIRGTEFGLDDLREAIETLAAGDGVLTAPVGA